jgi:hypothetical protein
MDKGFSLFKLLQKIDENRICQARSPLGPKHMQ